MVDMEPKRPIEKDSRVRIKPSACERHGWSPIPGTVTQVSRGFGQRVDVTWDDGRQSGINGWLLEVLGDE